MFLNNKLAKHINSTSLVHKALCVLTPSILYMAISPWLLVCFVRFQVQNTREKIKEVWSLLIKNFTCWGCKPLVKDPWPKPTPKPCDISSAHKKGCYNWSNTILYIKYNESWSCYCSLNSIHLSTPLTISSKFGVPMPIEYQKLQNTPYSDRNIPYFVSLIEP